MNQICIYILPKKLEGGKSKTASLPAGKASLKTKTYYKRDEEKLLHWLEQNADKFIKINKHIKWEEIRQTLKVVGDKCVNSDGEVLPGICVTKVEKINVKGAGSDEYI